MLAAVFASEQFGGVGYGEGVTMGSQLGVQAIGVISTLVYCAIATFIILKVVGAVVGLRVDEETETQGLDLAEHDERGYIL